MFGRGALDGLRNDFPGRALGLLPRFLFDPPDGLDGFHPGLVLDFLDEDALGFLLGHPGDPLEFIHLFLYGLTDRGLLDFEFFFLALETAFLLGGIPFFSFDGLEPPFHHFFFVDETPFGFGDFLPAFPSLVLEFGLAAEIFFLGLDGRFALDFVGLFGRFGQDFLGLLLDFSELPDVAVPLDQDKDQRRCKNDDSPAQDIYQTIHVPHLLEIFGGDVRKGGRGDRFTLRGELPREENDAGRSRESANRALPGLRRPKGSPARRGGRASSRGTRIYEVLFPRLLYVFSSLLR